MKIAEAVLYAVGVKLQRVRTSKTSKEGHQHNFVKHVTAAMYRCRQRRRHLYRCHPNHIRQHTLHKKVQEYLHLALGKYTRAQQHGYLINCQQRMNSNSRDSIPVFTITALSNWNNICANFSALLRNIVLPDVLSNHECYKSWGESELIEIAFSWLEISRSGEWVY